MELILVVVISAGMAGNSQNGVSRSLTRNSSTPVVVELAELQGSRVYCSLLSTVFAEEESAPDRMYALYSCVGYCRVQ